MSNDGDFPRRGKRENPRRRWAAPCWLSLLLLGIGLSLPREARSQELDSDPVECLRRALQASNSDLAARDRVVKQCLAGLHSLSDLHRAVSLVEWHESCPDEEVAAVDLANQAILIDWFSASVRRVLRQGDPAAKAETIDLLAQMAGLDHANSEAASLVARFAPELAGVVIHGPASQRGAAARVLSQCEPPMFVAVPALEELLQASDAELRQRAADGLAHLLQNALQEVGESSATVQRPAPRGQLVVVASSVLPAIHRGLDDARPEVRRRCVETIGLAGVALSRLITDPIPAGAEEANEFTSPRRPLDAEREELRPLILALRDQGPILARTLRDDEVEVRLQAHKTLEELGHARWRWTRRCAATEVRTAATEDDLLREVLREAVPGLAEALRHRDVRVRRSALDALEMMGPLALPALPALVGALRDPDRFLCWSAVRTLGKLGPTAAPLAAADLTRLLQDTDGDLRMAAATALARLKAAQPAATATMMPDTLRRSLQDPDPSVRVAAMHTLRRLKIDARPVLPGLLHALADPDARVRQAAAETLGAFGPAAGDAVVELRLIQKDFDAGVRHAADAALLQIVPPAPH